jgi:hypothetical protein
VAQGSRDEREVNARLEETLVRGEIPMVETMPHMTQHTRKQNNSIETAFIIMEH